MLGRDCASLRKRMLFWRLSWDSSVCLVGLGWECVLELGCVSRSEVCIGVRVCVGAGVSVMAGVCGSTGVCFGAAVFVLAGV